MTREPSIRGIIEGALTAIARRPTLRSWARRRGLLRYAHFFRVSLGLWGSAETNEDRFAAALQAAVRPGDCVWDIGANVGRYTAVFRDAVGPDGLVCAFEPAPACFAYLQAAEAPNVRAFNIALGDHDAQMMLNLADNPLYGSHSIVAAPRLGGCTVEVPVFTGDHFRVLRDLPIPQVIKIDVEGFEEEVLGGLGQTIQEPRCRAVFVELHFMLLEARGERNAPTRIERSLTALGFQVRWADPSHLLAQRRPVRPHWA